MEVNAVGSATDIQLVDQDQTGFAGMTSDSFMKLLITTLQNQDPTEPLGNDELLNQLSTMRNLQSNIELGNALKSITVSQQLSTATTFIGKLITGNIGDQQAVTGIADRALLKGGQAFIGIGDAEIPLAGVSRVNLVE